jgi:hypothetical protein
MGLYFSATGTAHLNVSLYGGDVLPNVVGIMSGGQTGTTGSATSNNFMLPFWGVYSATTAAFPSSIGGNQMSYQPAAQVDAYALIKEI